MKSEVVQPKEIEHEEIYEEVRDRAHKCSSCGFIIIGGSISEVCPGCGKKSKFLVVTKRLWKCSVCGYIHEGNEPPELCPVCGAGREEFYKLEV